ncbi:putative acetyltransferase YhhY [Tritonibacter multivorans]|uniref:Putative acetyltransferase YhhY n=1 Tax=Tritonibacter multivorans TaxID=928856 RepID=A0A0P1H0K8_9RHOB|nr:GNAT family N-acetyltransferase [Tritonibacter multivorans]MDA7420627.1 GNAT family N-acetyltransferase [Tritonibacter multivorans]CUH81244.1 putative acetyltransferase YhhY [Tritonibacter multivorans]SFC31538.1 Ribosomal protein S18 acetylase RimI [Tritonibacter multivorans]
MKIEQLTTIEWPRYRRLRLRALQDSPEAFCTSHETEAHWDPEQWQRRLTGTYTTFVAVLDGRDCGLVTVAALRGQPQDAGLFGMWVAAEARGYGAARALVAAAVEWARAGCYNQLFLDVIDDNGPAITLYARCGFVPTGQVGRLAPPRDHITEHQRVLPLHGSSA